MTLPQCMRLYKETRVKENGLPYIGSPEKEGRFPYLCMNAKKEKVICYAPNMKQGVKIYQWHFNEEPYFIRQMSDNE